MHNLAVIWPPRATPKGDYRPTARCDSPPRPSMASPTASTISPCCTKTAWASPRTRKSPTRGCCWPPSQGDKDAATRRDAAEAEDERRQSGCCPRAGRRGGTPSRCRNMANDARFAGQAWRDGQPPRLIAFLRLQPTKVCAAEDAAHFSFLRTRIFTSSRLSFAHRLRGSGLDTACDVGASGACRPERCAYLLRAPPKG